MHKKLHEMLSGFMYQILDRAPPSLIPDAITMTNVHSNNTKLPRILIVPTGTDLHLYGDEIERLNRHGIVVIHDDGEEISELLWHLNRE